MNKDEIAMKCVRCGKQYRVLEMVMDANKRGMVCRACAGIQPRPGVKLERAPIADGTVARRRFQCADCSYRFMSSKPSPVCGYCGSAHVKGERENSADALILDSQHRRFGS